MAIANKLEIIYDSCKDIRDVITEKNSSLGKGSITTLGSDVTKICNPNSYIHKVNINPQELQHLDNENITIENYGNCGNTKTRGAIYIPLAGAYNWTGTFTINDGSILQYTCGITATAPTTGVNVTSITNSGWKTTGSGTTSYSTAANCNYLYLVATYIDGATGIPTFEEFVSNATFSLTAYGKNGSVREDDYVGLNYTSVASAKYKNDINLSNVIIPDTVTTIGANAFNGCTNLSYINLENVTILYTGAFYNTSSLKILNMPKLSGFVNGGQQFRNSGIIEIQSLGTITSAPDGDLNGGFCYNCKSLETVNLPDTLTKIAKSMFYGCSKLKTVNCNNVTRVDNFAFTNCSSLSDFERFDICTFIGTSSFTGTLNLKIELSVPNLISIRDGAFYNSRITKVLDLGKITTLPDIASYTQATFGENPSLTEVHLPSTLTKIGKFTFGNNANLTTIVCLATTPPSLNASAIRNYATNVHFYVPYSEDHSILAAYQAATNWTSHSSRIHELNSDGSIPV